MVGDDIEITVVDVRGDKVRLGINAPSEVPVHRKEVYEKIKLERGATGGGSRDLSDKGKRSYRMFIQDEMNYRLGF